PYDRDEMRSKEVSIAQTSLDIKEDCYEFGYLIDSPYGVAPSQTEITVFGPAVENFKVYYGPLAGGTHLGSWNFADFPQDVVRTGGQPFHTVVSGKDDDRNNKAHQRKPLREAKRRRGPPTAALFYAHYRWDISGKDKQGNTTWTLQQDSQGSFQRCVIPAMANLLTGAFYAPPVPPKGSIFFPLFWVAKKEDKWNGFLIVCPAINASDIALALQTVDVFFFAGHGDGYQLEAVNFSQDGSYTQSFFSPYPRLSYNFSNLHLAVIATCRHRSAVITKDEFPLVDNLVGTTSEERDKGARFAIGVMGMSDKAVDWQTHQYVTINDWYFIFSITIEEWAKRFWELASKGDKDAKKMDEKYPTMGKAALKAARRANEEALSELSQRLGVNFRVYIHTAGQDDYLGHIEGTF
ncbi:MAG: hypothetical protein ACP5KZ_09415, partial [bacterium]